MLAAVCVFGSALGSSRNLFLGDMLDHLHDKPARFGRDRVQFVPQHMPPDEVLHSPLKDADVVLNLIREKLSSYLSHWRERDHLLCETVLICRQMNHRQHG